MAWWNHVIIEMIIETNNENSRKTSEECRKSGGRPSAVLSVKKTAEEWKRRKVGGSLSPYKYHFSANLQSLIRTIILMLLAPLAPALTCVEYPSANPPLPSFQPLLSKYFSPLLSFHPKDSSLPSGKAWTSRAYWSQLMVGPSLRRSLQKRPSARSTTEHRLSDISGQGSMGSSLAHAKRCGANKEVANDESSWYNVSYSK